MYESELNLRCDTKYIPNIIIKYTVIFVEKKYENLHMLFFSLLKDINVLVISSLHVIYT